MEEKKEITCLNCENMAQAHFIVTDESGLCTVCGKFIPSADGVSHTLTFKDPGSHMGMTATLWSMLSGIKHEATRAREYLRLEGSTCTPDRIHEILHLKTSRATLARKMREACRRGELLRVPYTNERGTEIAAYCWNPEYKEKI